LSILDPSRLPYPVKVRLLQLLQGMPSAPEEISSDVSRETPQEFIWEVLGERPTEAALRHGYKVPWTPDQGQIFESVLVNRKTAVVSGNSCGKTAALARLALWFLYRKPGSLVITTAPTKRQVEELLWGEIRMLFKKSKVPLPGRQLLTSIKVDEKWQAIGFTSSPEQGDITTTTFQGFHAPQILVVVDEATGTDPLIMPSIEGICTGPDDRIVAIGNPTNIDAWFYKACHEWDAAIQMDARNHPNVVHNDHLIIPGAATYIWVVDREKEWGKESPLFRAKVCGIWPEQSEEALIQLHWIDRSKALYEQYKEFGRPADLMKRGAILGLDVAGEGEDLTVLSALQGGLWEIPIINGQATWHVGRDVMAAVDLVLKLIDSGLPVRMICVDDTAIGAGVSARLRQLMKTGRIPPIRLDGASSPVKITLYPINFKASAWAKSKFQDIKDELWWEAHEMFRDGEIAIPTDKDQARWRLPKGHSIDSQLTTAIYSQDNSGRVMVLDKRSNSPGQKERTKHLPRLSPDVAHSCILCCWGWKRLEHSRELAAPPIVDQNEWFAARLRKMAIKGSRLEKKHPKRLPWQKIPTR
jgi:hypothetical protein